MSMQFMSPQGRRNQTRPVADIQTFGKSRTKDTTFQPKPPGNCKDCGKKLQRSAWLNKNMCYNEKCPGKKTIGQIEAEKKAKHSDEPTDGAMFAARFETPEAPHGVTEEHHKVLHAHGYKYAGENPHTGNHIYIHDKHPLIAHRDGRTWIDRKAYTKSHEVARQLRMQKHGLSDESVSGANFTGRMAPDGVDPQHHQTLVNHGYEYRGRRSDASGEHLYVHKSGDGRYAHYNPNSRSTTTANSNYHTGHQGAGRTARHDSAQALHEHLSRGQDKTNSELKFADEPRRTNGEQFKQHCKGCGKVTPHQQVFQAAVCIPCYHHMPGSGMDPKKRK